MYRQKIIETPPITMRLQGLKQCFVFPGGAACRTDEWFLELRGKLL